MVASSSNMMYWSRVQSEKSTKLQQVYYAPGMSYRLLSTGSLIQKGLSLHGERDIMSIRKPDGQSVMDFHPHAQEPSIYWLSARIVKDKRVIEGLALSTINSYDLWHRHLGHPSSDVICQFSQNTVGLPDTVPIPKDVPVCKGCSEGKMTSSSFPDSKVELLSLLVLFIVTLSSSLYNCTISTNIL